jgi:hypothetical protein
MSDEKLVYAYVNNKAVYEIVKGVRSKDYMHVGCAQGPFCQACTWSSAYPKCKNGEIYCNKPNHTPCPGWP